MKFTISPPDNEDVTPEIAACSSETEDVVRKMCSLLFPKARFWTVLRQQECRTQTQTHHLPGSRGLLTPSSLHSALLRRCGGVPSCHSSPVKDVIAWTALNCLALSKPWASSAGSRCAWSCSLTWFCSSELSRTERKEWGAAADAHRSPCGPEDGFKSTLTLRWKSFTIS